ncbi:predicted protein, partial [Nematostella vectensis]
PIPTPSSHKHDIPQPLFSYTRHPIPTPSSHYVIPSPTLSSHKHDIPSPPPPLSHKHDIPSPAPLLINTTSPSPPLFS